MPDLNWEEQRTRNAIFASSMEFWLKRGVDGFRIDACGLYSKRFPPVKDCEKAGAFSEDEIRLATPVEEAGDADQEPLVFDFEAYGNGPRKHEFMRELRARTTAQFGHQIMFIVENSPTYAEGLRLLDPVYREEDVYFDFSLYSLPDFEGISDDSTDLWDRSTMSCVKCVKMHSPDSLRSGRDTHPVLDLHCAEDERMPTPPLPLAYLIKAFMRTQSFVTDHDRWCTVWLDIHDMPRSISRFGHQGINQSFGITSAKLLAIMQTTLSGSLFLYQGQEIGMPNIPVFGPQKRDLNDLRDVWFLRKIKASVEKYEGRNDEEAQTARETAWGTFDISGRDHARTPMQWADDENAGLCSDSETPWMHVKNTEHDGVSVAEQQGQAGSLLESWRSALETRKQYEGALCYGRTKFADNTNESVFSYFKETFDGKQKLLVVMNFSDAASMLPDMGAEIGVGPEIYSGQVILSNDHETNSGKLDEWEGRVYEICKECE